MTNIWYGSLLLLLSCLATDGLAADKTEGEDTSVNIKFDDVNESEEPEDGAFPYAPPIEQLFSNPAIAHGLASGADALNRSVESLMDSLFYSILDSEKNFYMTDDAWFNTTLKRDVYSTPSGAFVVMDRFQLGPRYAKELWRLHNVPISLGIDGTVEVLQIYLRTDGMRLAEQDELSPPRRWLNSWFGLLPLASTVMPPSFNQNELYDPLTELKTPFTFPLDLEGFYSMPVGSIRSYALSGGVQVGADLGGAQGQDSRETLDRVGGLTMTVPYAIFKRGEHRINVLRRSEHSAWIGVKDLRRVGHSISPFIGTKYSVFRAALAAKIFDWDWVWAGVPIAVLPVDLNFEQAIADLFDQVYEYDMRNPSAREAYEAAVKGDFVPSKLRYLDQKEKGVDTGVTFHFARVQDRKEEISRNGPNLAVYRRERKRDHGEAEIEITDPDGKFYILESSLAVEDKNWDVLVGDEQGRVNQSVEMKVRRVVPSNTDGDLATGHASYTYAFEADPDPYRLTMSLSIQDRYLDTVEYYEYLDDIRFFTGLDLETTPKIRLRDPEVEEERRRSIYFAEPTNEAVNVHVTPTYLGRFGAQATLSFSTQQLERIIATPEDDMWASFARAFGADDNEWRQEDVRHSFAHQLNWYKSFFLFPTRLLNIRISQADAIKESTQAIKELLLLKTLTTPQDKLDAFNRLLDSDYPRHLAHVLLDLANPADVPRRVTFSAQPKGAARHEVKTAYGKLNGMVFKAGPVFPEPTRYARAKTKLANFYLDQPRESSSKPHILTIEVHAKPVPASVRSLEEEPDTNVQEIDRNARHVFVTVTASGLNKDAEAKLYVRVAQAGKIKIGKLELAEKVLQLAPKEAIGATSDVLTYEFYLTGPLSPLSNFMLNQAVGSGDEFLVTLGVSRDGTVWSDERALEFRFEKGRLSPAN